MCLKYEPSSELLRIYAKYFLNYSAVWQASSSKMGAAPRPAATSSEMDAMKAQVRSTTESNVVWRDLSRKMV